MACAGPDKPDERNYEREMRKTLNAQMRLMPDVMRAEQAWAPQFAILGNQLAGMQREGDIADVERYGLRAQEAALDGSPYNRALLDKLNASANQDLDMGSAVSPETMRQIRNSLLAERGGMGWGYDPGDMAAVGMSTGMQGEQLKSERQARALRTLNANQSVLGDVFTRVLGTPGNTAARGELGASILEPESAYAGNLYNANQQTDWQYKQAMPSGMSRVGQGMSIFGNLMGSFAKAYTG